MVHLNKYVVYEKRNVLSFLLLLLIFVSATIDTHMFVYSSLSRTLISEILILISAAVALLSCIINRVRFINTKLDWLTLTWIVYIAIHYACIDPHEQYRTIYLIVSLMLIPTLSVLLRSNLVNRTQCENILLIVAAIHIIYVIAQWIGIIESGNISSCTAENWDSDSGNR